MEFQSAFDSMLASKNPLARLNALIWQNLVAGARSNAHPWNEGYFSTVEADDSGVPAPRTRTVIVRRADHQSRSIDLHTDVRSAKVKQLELGNPSSRVCWLFYSPPTKIQLRLEGSAELISGDGADAAWKQTPLRSRSAYVSIDPPGAVGLGSQPPDTSDRIVTQSESERGRANFRIVRTAVRAAEWLYLRREGHVRARIDYDDAGAAVCKWVVP